VYNGNCKNKNKENPMEVAEKIKSKLKGEYFEK
jgi:hypothetical protein